MLHGVPPTIGGIPSLQICHKFKMFQRISFKKQLMPFSQLVTDSINIIMPGDGKEWDVSASVRFQILCFDKSIFKRATINNPGELIGMVSSPKKNYICQFFYKSTVLNLEKAGFGVNSFEPHKLVMGRSNPVHQCLQEGIVDSVPVLPTPLVGGWGSQRASSSKIGKLLAWEVVLRLDRLWTPPQLAALNSPINGSITFGYCLSEN